MTPSFGQRVRDGIARRGPLCVGIDPHPALIDDWGLPQSAEGLRRFGLTVVEATVGRAAFVKPQVSFFERFGSAGLAALEEVLSEARAAGLIAIADAKRGDIGSTMAAYAEAWLAPGAPLEADALTVSPYLGVGALAGAAEFASRHGKGLFVLAATSNPEAAGLQRSSRDGTVVSAQVIDEVSRLNAASARPGEWGACGFVIGATIDWDEAGIAPFSPVAPILAPGFGHQGARPDELASRYGAMAHAVLASESRSILSAGSERIAHVIEDHARRYPAVENARGNDVQEQDQDE